MDNPRIAIVQHVPWEGPAWLGQWLYQQGYGFERYALFRHESFPAPEDFDLLIVLGGPMGVYQIKDYSWLQEEKDGLARVLESQKPVLGICLGAQLLAEALGASVYKNPVTEVGWWRVHFPSDERPAFLSQWPEEQTVFHWHSDAFTLPEGATRIGWSEGCDPQGFAWGERVVGLQFHLECTPEAMVNMLNNGGDMLQQQGPFVQSAEQIRAGHAYAVANHTLLKQLMNHLLSIIPAPTSSI
jgi:GMP synthase-like glutamine amidotransferase